MRAGTGATSGWAPTNSASEDTFLPEIIEVSADALTRYALIPISFDVRSILRVEPVESGLKGFRLTEERIVVPYVKDYDRGAGEDERPTRWPARFDIRNWGVFLAVENEQPVGGAVVAFDTAGVDMLEGRKDLAVLWDIRVKPDSRRRGVGTTLFRYAADWARARGCRQLKVETQNTNVPACRFYAGQGCVLGAINRYGYAAPELAGEVMLLWYLDL